jgi:tetratricopeptide (TPR) repeat protein
MNSHLAIYQYDKALEVKSDFDPAYFLRGMTYVQQGDLEKAKQDFRRVQQSTANETRRQNAEHFLRAIESRLQSAPHYSDAKRQGLVAQMFSDNREARITATTALLLEWKQDPQLAPAILAMLRAHLTDSNGSNFSKSRGREVDSGYALVGHYYGIVSSLIVLQNLDPQLLRPHEAEITALLKQVENMGPRTKWHADKVRKVLATPPSKNLQGSAG